MKKTSAYIRAFILLICIFFTVGIVTLGSVSTGGKNLLVHTNAPVYFSLVDKDGATKSQTVDAVYVKLGAVYKNVDEQFSITVGVSTTATASNANSTSAWPSANKKNIAIKTVSDGAQYNWLKIAQDWDKDGIKSLYFQANANVELIEIVCLDKDGKAIGLNGFLAKESNDYNLDEVAYAYDAQNSFNASESAYHNLTAEESYYLTSANTLLSGREYVNDSQYILDENNNYLYTAIIGGSVALFGVSPFAVRLPAFLAACTLILCAYLLMKELFKSEKYAFIGVLLLCLGGAVTVLGRFGAPYAVVTSAIVASAYFMYRFFAKGISSDRVYNDGANVLYSGLFAAVAVCIDASAIFPVIGVLTLFGFGLHRQKTARKLALARMEESADTENKVARIHAKYAEKVRVCYAYAALSFVAGTLLLAFASAVLCYTAFIKVNGNVDKGFASLIWYGLKNSIVGNGFTAYGAENTSNVLTWFLPWKAATLYQKSGESYLVWSVLPNAALCYACFVALIVTTFTVAKGFVVKAQDKQALRVRRAYFVLLLGLAFSMVAAACKIERSVVNGLLFHVCYVGFLPLAATAFSSIDGKDKKSKAFNALLWIIVALAAAVFFVSLPSIYGFGAPTSYAKAFGWTAIVNNGFFR